MHVHADGTVEDAWAHAARGPGALPEASITAVLQDRGGAVWVGSSSGVVLRFPDGRPGRRIELPGAADGSPATVDAIYEDARGQVWIGTSGHGVFVHDPAAGRVAQLQPAGAADPAYSDAPTALPNRRRFGDCCRQMIATGERQDAGFALLLIDLDHFKQVNDTLGHDAGDALLVETARRLRDIARKADVVARLGGDEFAILLADTAVPGAVDIACRRIVEAFDAPVPHEGHEMRASPSIGVALFPADGTTQDEPYKSADLALYEAKRSGRHTWRFAQWRAPGVTGET